MRPPGDGGGTGAGGAGGRTVLVTGGTGLVGSHAVAALRAAGDGVRLLARTPSKVPRVLRPLDVDPDAVTVVAGGMTDADAVGAAVAGCDAVVHAAAERHPEPAGPGGRDPNVEGVRTVVGAALDRGVERIVYTSSVAAYLPVAGDAVTPASDLGEPETAYARSKRDAERLVRSWQADGAPITTLVLGGVHGPVSPHTEDSFAAVRAALESVMIVLEGGMGVIDVRDLAAAITAAASPARRRAAGQPRVLMAGGRFVTWQRWVDVLSEAVGRPVPTVEMDAGRFLELARELDEQREAGQEPDAPLTEEAALTMLAGAPTDDQQTHRELGVDWRPTVETFRDQVAWMIARGHLDPDLAPAVRPDEQPDPTKESRDVPPA